MVCTIIKLSLSGNNLFLREAPAQLVSAEVEQLVYGRADATQQYRLLLWAGVHLYFSLNGDYVKW